MNPPSLIPSSDHRAIMNRLDLGHLREEAPGMVFWHPAGFELIRRLEEAARVVLRRQGYAEVRSPQLLRQPVWEASGHWSHFRDGMFEVGQGDAAAALKPVSCPAHVLMAKRRAPSYRDLPLRYAEFGVVHRNEPQSALHGLLRLRQFVQDDGHVFCVDEDQARAEVVRFCREVVPFYRAFGFEEVEVGLSLRPESRVGDEARWDRAEAALAQALEALGLEHRVQPGDGAFYGPKIEFHLRDRHGRAWQCGTIQLDLAMPGRFGLSYVDASGERREPVMLHRALYGSLERFIGMLLEHHAGALPPWLAPVQVALCPISAAQDEAARWLAEGLAESGLRVELLHAGSLRKRLAIAHDRGIPIQLLLGRKELESGQIGLRQRGRQEVLDMHALRPALERLCRRPELSG